jgi:hypothetical protein
MILFDVRIAERRQIAFIQLLEFHSKERDFIELTMLDFDTPF